MGRELKRVALNFDWPVGKTWKGYVNELDNPAKKCDRCGGSGLTPFAKYLQDKWYGKVSFDPETSGSAPFTVETPAIRALAERHIVSAPAFYGRGEESILREAVRLCSLFNGRWSHHLNADDVAALLKANRLYDFTHFWTKEAGWKPKPVPIVPTPQQVNEWSLIGFGHDSINQWVCVESACKRAGEPSTCARCDGEGAVWPSPEARAIYEGWERTEPPAGEGFQMWETVSEGSPISPVFATARELAEHLAKTNRGVDKGTTVETWLKFIEGPGWAPSMIGMPGVGIVSGVEGVSGPSAS